MGQEFSRHELLVEASAAATKLGEFGSRGDRRRFSDDEVFQYAINHPRLWQGIHTALGGTQTTLDRLVAG
jgi:hypothetical protein